MPEDDDVPVYMRAHLAKRGKAVASRADGGSIAVGSLIALAGFAITLLVPVIGSYGFLPLAMGMFVGGFATARLFGNAGLASVLHAFSVGIFSVGVIALVSFASVFATAEDTDLVIATSDPVTNMATIFIALVLATAGGVLGRNR